MWTLLRFALVSLLAVLVAMLPGGVAHAHDELIGSEPGDGDTVQAPDELVLTYSGQISQLGAQVMVTGEDDVDVVDGELVVEGVDLIVPLSDDVPAGDYEVVWRVTSEDGHPISGTFEFTVEATEEATEEVTADDVTEEATEDATGEEATEEATTDATDQAIEDATTDATDPAEETASDESTTGVPVWVWVVGGLVALGLAALLVGTWNRGRSAD